MKCPIAAFAATLALAFSSFAVLPQTGALAAMTGTGQVVSETYAGSRARDYRVYIPQSYDGTSAVPMIMALHGCAMDHDDARALWNLDLVADREGAIVVYPFVTSFSEFRNENCWGYWLDVHVREGRGGEVDDLHGIAQAVEAAYNIDPARRYVTGLSSGGAMALAAGIAYNDYWAAAAPVAGLPYGDWSSSVTADLFQDLSAHVAAIEAELDDPRPLPTLVIQSSNDTVVLPRAMELIRDSQLTVWGGDLQADSAEDCSAEGIACTLTSYDGPGGTPLVKTLLYDGLPAQSASYGQGHYWTGDDEDQALWAKAQGPSASEAVWAFFSGVTLGGAVPPPACGTDGIAPAAPTGLALSSVTDDGAVLTLDPNTESDLAGYKIYSADGTVLTPSPAASASVTVTGLAAGTSYEVYATALDLCGNESPASFAVSFTTAAPSYIAPSVTASATAHYNAGRLSVSEYIAYGTQYGYIDAFTLWQLEDGSWTDADPNGGSGGGGGGGGGGDTPVPGSWTTQASLSGMEVHLYTPATTTANGRRALMIALHGCAQANEVVRDNWSWADEADEYGMVVAAPMAPGGGVIAGCWDYYGTNHDRSSPARHDDNLIALAQALIADASLDIDPDQVYISGLSSGGGQSFVMGCVAPEIFAGIGIAAGPAVGTGSSQIGSVATSAAQAENLCRSFADAGNGAGFSTQIASIVHGLSDFTVAQGYAAVNAEALAGVYGAAAVQGSTAIPGGGSEERFADAAGPRVQKIMVTGLGHAWPASADSSGGSYTDHSTIDYPAALTAFLFANNRRADFSAGGDVTPPSVPTGLAVAGTTPSSVSLAWNASPDQDLSFYTVYKDGAAALTTSASTAEVAGLAAETAYVFAVTATDQSGNESVPSGTVEASTQPAPSPGDTVPPAIPTGLQITASAEDSLNAAWTANMEADLAGYRLYLDGVLVLSPQTAQATLTGLDAGTDYLIEVSAVDQSSNESGRAAVTGTTDPGPVFACMQDTASTYSHVNAGRAYLCGSFNSYACASGSGQNLGFWNIFNIVTLAQTAPGFYEQRSCP